MKKTIVILLSLFFVACASRKVDRTITHAKTQVTQTTKDTSNIKQHSTIKIQDTTSFEEKLFEPIDSTKEFIIDGKIFKNVKIKTSKSKKGITILKEKDSVANQSKTTNTRITQEIDTNDKHIDKGSSSWIWIVVIAAIVLVYFDYKRH